MFEWLFDRSMGLPGPGGRWPPWMTVLFHTSNFVTAMALMFIPLTIAGLMRRKRRGVRPGEWAILLSIFPALAMSRLMRFLEIYGPPYNLTTLTDTGSAIVSVWAVSKLPAVAEHIALLPSRNDIHDLREQLNGAIMERESDRMANRESIRQIRRRIDHIEIALDTETWADDVRRAIAEMRAILAEIEGGGDDARD